MKLIPLTQTRNTKNKKLNLFAQVDDKNFDEIIKYKWYAQKAYNGFYAARRDENKKFILMHRYIMKTPKKMYCDHINHDGLCNLENNLRNCTNSENGMNRKAANKNSTSGIIGVGRCSRNKNKWKAQIMINRKPIFIGRFETLEEAVCARKKKEKELFGEFSNPNL